MQKCSVFVMVAAGIVLGIILFLLRRTLSPATCKQCGILKREFFLSAAIVSSLLSYMALCASSVMAKEKDGQTVQETSPTTTTNLDVLKQSKEWQDLKVLWNLITGDQGFFYDDADDSRRIREGIPRWKESLLLAVVDQRIKQLDRLVNQGVLITDTSKAIASLFHDMISHVIRANSGATCYMTSAEGGRWVGAINDLHSQMEEIRKQSKAGTLNEVVIRSIEKQLREKLTVMKILGDWPSEDITEEEIGERFQHWQKQGKINKKYVRVSLHKQLTEEIVKERRSTLSGDQLARRQAAWMQDQQMVLDLTVDLGRYVRNRAAEKEVHNEFCGNTAMNRLVDGLKTANRYEKDELISGLGVVGGTDAVPRLRELLNDKTLQYVQRSSSDNGDAMTVFVAYSVRDKAIDVLKELGVDASEKSERKAESPEGRAMVRETLESKDHEVQKSGIWVAGKTKDKSLIPLLKAILAEQPSLRDEILEELGELGDASSLPLIVSAAEEEGAYPDAICSALGDIGTKEALECLQNLAFTSKDPSMRATALHKLADKKDKTLIPLFKEALKDSQLLVRFEAASALQQLDCNDGYSVFVEASKSDDPDFQEDAIDCLVERKDPRADEYLKTYIQPSKETGEDQARWALLDKGGADALKVLEEVLKGSDSEDNKVKALRRIGQAKAEVPGLEAVLIHALTSEAEDIRSAAISALGEKGTTNAIPSLLTCNQFRIYEVPEALKAIRQRSYNQQQGSFLADLTSADPVKRQEAEKWKSNLSFADIQSLGAVLDDQQKTKQEKETAKKVVAELGARCIGPFIQYLSEMYSLDTPSREFVETLDVHMEETIPQLMAFIREPSHYGRENMINFLYGGREYRDRQYPWHKIAGLQELLTKCCADKNEKVRVAARRLLIKMESTGDLAFDTILIGLSDPSWDAQCETLQALKYNDKPFTAEQRSKIATVLVLLLKEKLESSSEETLKKYTIESMKEYVIEAMEVFPDRGAIPVLQKMIRQGESDRNSLYRFRFVRDNFTPVQLAAKLLYSLSDEQTIPFWKEIASGDDDVLALWAHAALYKFNQDKDEHLKQMGMLLRDTRKRSVRLAGKAIIKSLDDKACVPLLRDYLCSDISSTVKSIKPNPRVSISSDHDNERQEAFKLLVDVGGEDVLEDVKRIFLEDRDGYLRRDAVDYLISLAGQDAVPLLLQGLQDPSPGVRYHICEVIWIADGKDVIAALKNVADEDPYTHKDEGYEVREEAKKALKKIELRASDNMRNRLIQEAKNTQSNLRDWAIERLRELKDDPAVVEALKELLKDEEKSSACQ